MSFQQLGLPSPLLQNLTGLGFNEPTPIQAQAIPVVREGSDLIAIAQTGTGKTGAFIMPIIESMLNRPENGVKAVVLTPTRELAQQIHEVFRNLSRGMKLRSVAVIGGEPIPQQLRKLREGADIIIATPGRLLAYLREGSLSLPNVRTLVIDEADLMFDMGFIPDVRQIVGKLPKDRQSLMFSATMPPELAKIGRTLVREPKHIETAKQGTATTTVTHTAYPVPSGRKGALLEHLLERLDNPSVLVFTRTKHAAKKLARRLHTAGHDVGELHSNRTPSQRARAMQGFRDREFRVLVATNIAARGIDVRHVTHVVNFDVPEAPEEYVHRIGRTGRGGDSGAAMVFVAPEENGRMSRIERQLGKKIQRLKLDDFDYSTNANNAFEEREADNDRPFRGGERPFRGGDRPFEKKGRDNRGPKRDKKPNPNHPMVRLVPASEMQAPQAQPKPAPVQAQAPTPAPVKEQPKHEPRGFNRTIEQRVGGGEKVHNREGRFFGKKPSGGGGGGKKGFRFGGKPKKKGKRVRSEAV